MKGWKSGRASAGEVRQFDGAARPVLAQLVEQAAQDVGPDLLLEQALQVGQRERLLRRQQRALDDALGFRQIRHTQS
jgi:hypothetical protein